MRTISYDSAQCGGGCKKKTQKVGVGSWVRFTRREVDVCASRSRDDKNEEER